MIAYKAAKPKQFGNLHERMKLLVQLAQAHVDEIPYDVWNAIVDLETEVRGHKPAKPPYGRRTVSLGKT